MILGLLFRSSNITQNAPCDCLLLLRGGMSEMNSFLHAGREKTAHCRYPGKGVRLVSGVRVCQTANLDAEGVSLSAETLKSHILRQRLQEGHTQCQEDLHSD